ncbi:LHPL3-like protein [Mya arenaria]|uniref:LHPL3-like protein n=1 Tax=Mya arenaria TaxID=6604 RepID=A0ABY7FU80_MYAAR|nr:LHPL3-like protein [Mya arenaria]
MAMQRYDRETLFFFAYHFNKNHRAIAVAWAVLSIVFCVLVCLAFTQPQWIGDTEDSPGFGHMGVYQYCLPDDIDASYNCEGSFTSFETILTDEFKATTVFVGVSALFMLIVVGALVMFFCFKKGYVFVICGVLELMTGFKPNSFFIPEFICKKTLYYKSYKDMQLDKAARVVEVSDSVEFVRDSAASVKDNTVQLLLKTVAFVRDSAASFEDSVAFVRDSAASVEDSVAFVRDSAASVEDSVAFVSDSAASVEDSVAFVRVSTASVEDSVAFVRDSAASVEDSVAFARDSAASVEDSVAFVRDSAASVEDSVAFVRDSAASVEDSVAFVRDSAASVEDKCICGVYIDYNINGKESINNEGFVYFWPNSPVIHFSDHHSQKLVLPVLYRCTTELFIGRLSSIAVLYTCQLVVCRVDLTLVFSVV